MTNIYSKSKYAKNPTWDGAVDPTINNFYTIYNMKF